MKWREMMKNQTTFSDVEYLNRKRISKRNNSLMR